MHIMHLYKQAVKKKKGIIHSYALMVDGQRSHAVQGSSAMDIATHNSLYLKNKILNTNSLINRY